MIVGSHIQKTTMQLMRLFEVPGILPIQFDQHTVLVEGGLDQEVDRVSQATEEAIGKGVSVVVYTRRERVDFPSDDPASNLLLSVSIANALTSVVGRLRLRPSFLVAKGGITSCDVGVQALRVRKARVLGQIAAGVPVWRTGQESKFPGLSYVIFPGNVGDEDSLARIVASLMYLRVKIAFIPTEIYKILPYIVTVVILVLSSIRNNKEKQPPASLGINYFREER